MSEKTIEDMKHRLSQLRAMLQSHTLTLRLSAELDAIQNYGIEGWRSFLKKKRRRK